MVGVYSYVCQHDNCKKVVDGIRKCKDCDMLIITDRGT